jgi:multisubunit Na+/H+ antiporter MnhC subunit
VKRELTSQELLDRYIHAIKMTLLLPPDEMEDIVSEVRSNLESQVDDQARALGRELRPEEVSALLKQHGHPLKVALRYREKPVRSLISPALFPLYWFTLRAILVLWMTIRLIVLVFALQGSSPVASLLLALGRDVLFAALIIPAGVTLLFAVWEYLELRYRYSERWKPEALGPVPPCPPHHPKPWPKAGFIGGIVWLVFLALALYSPWFFWVWGGRGVFSPSDALYATRFPLWLLAFFVISSSWLSDTRFAASTWLHVLRVGVVAAGVALAIFLLGHGDLLVAGPKWDPTQAKSLATLNQMIAGVLVLACIVVGLPVLLKFVRIIRRRSSHGGTAHVAS